MPATHKVNSRKITLPPKLASRSAKVRLTSRPQMPNGKGAGVGQSRDDLQLSVANPRLSPRDQKICALYAAGTPVTEIAESHGLSSVRVYQIIKNYQESPRKRGRPARDSVTSTDRLPGANGKGINQRKTDLHTPVVNPQPTTPLSSLIAQLIGVNKEHRMLIVAHGDFVRRVKSMQRWQAVVRTRAEGKEIEGRKFPPVTEADEAIVEEKFPRLIQSMKFEESQRNAAEKDVLELTRQLPPHVIDWFTSIEGLALGSLAMIVGDAGDLSNYPKPCKLWKRFSLHVVDDKAARRVKGKGAKEQEFVPERRATMQIIGGNLIRSGKSDYAKLYRDRKQYEIAKAEAQGLEVRPAARIPEENKELYISEGLIHLRAMRYMQKRLLKDLLRVWKHGDAPATVVVD